MENPERITYFAATDSRGSRIPFGIKAKDRSKHMYVIGKTGMGKSKLLENLAIQDIQNGEGLAFVDPHGESAERLLSFVPEHRIKDVIYFAPFDMEHPIAFNVMEDVGYDRRHLVVSGLMSTFKKIWVDAWSARMEYILSNTLLALLEYPGATLMGVNRMYTDKEYRAKVVDNIKDPLVKDFWEKEFATYTDRYTQEATPAIQNKIGQFTSNPLVRNIIGQSKSSFDVREVMDKQKILIINLSKGLVGDTNQRLLGSMITTRIYLGAMSRADLPAAELAKLPSFNFYVDEFQNFANETFAEILSEARKYKLNLTIAHQYIEQMEEEVRDAVFGNVGTTIAFRVGPFDAEVLETVFAPKFTQEDIVNLGKFQIYLSLMIDGVGSQPFSAVTIPPIEPPPVTYEKEVIANSRTVYGNKREKIEESIRTELASTKTHKELSAAGAQKGAVNNMPPRGDRPYERRPFPPRPSERPTERRESERKMPPREYREPQPRPAPPPAPRPPEPPRQEREEKPKEEKKPVQSSQAQGLRETLRRLAEESQKAKEKKKGEAGKPLKEVLAKVTPRPPEPSRPPVEQKKTEPSQTDVSEETLKKILNGEM